MNLLSERQDIVDNESGTEFFCSTSNESISLVDSDVTEREDRVEKEREGRVENQDVELATCNHYILFIA